MGKALELSGKVFGKLLVIERAKTRLGSNWQWVCRCECGKEKTISGSNLVSSNSTSCGCSHIQHGHSKRGDGGKSPEYTVWHGLIGICYCPTDEQFHNYGAKGIKVCTRWRNSFPNFLQDMGAKPLHHTLSRKDPAKGFNPDNCFWKEGWFRPFESMYHRAKRETEERKSRGHKFELTYKEFLEFTCISACHYCGFDVGWKDCAKAPYNLDRKDNEGNYTKDNCVVCCFECNATKGSRFTYEEMLIIGAAVREVKLARKAKYPMLQLVEGVRA